MLMRPFVSINPLYCSGYISTVRPCLTSIGGGMDCFDQATLKKVACPTGTTSSGGTSSTSSTGTTNDFGLLGWLLGLDPASRMAAQQKAARKAAVLRELENQRQEAIRRDTEHAKFLEDVAQRLQNGDLQLKGTSSNELQLKLSPTGPIKFGEYMSTPATQTTSARLTLKTGDDATSSLQTSTPNASSAGVINPNQPPAFNADQMTPETRELADMLSKLTPEQQQRLIAAIKTASAGEATVNTSATASQPNADSSGSTGQGEPLKLKLSTAQQSADDLNAAAQKANMTSEQLSDQAAKDFNNLANVSTLSSTAKTVNGVSATGVTPTTVTGNSTSATIKPMPADPTRNSELTRIMKQKVEVPMWRPEGWVVSASKGDTTLNFVNSIKETPGCDSAAQQDVLARLATKAKQLADIEIVINRLNASSPRLQAELAETTAEMEKKRDEFIDAVEKQLGEELFKFNKAVQAPEFLDLKSHLSEAEELGKHVKRWSEISEAAKGEVRTKKAGVYLDLLAEISKAMKGLQSPAFNALRQPLRPFAFLNQELEKAEFAAEVLDTFAYLIAFHNDVIYAGNQIDARNHALAKIEPRHKG